MTKRSPSIDRAVRIERAAIERESLAQGIASAGRKLEPASLIKGLRGWHRAMSRWAAGHRPGAPLSTGQLVAVRHVHAGRQALCLLKVAAGALVGWQLWKTWKRAARPRTSAEFTSCIRRLPEKNAILETGWRSCLRAFGPWRYAAHRDRAHDRASQGSSWMQKSTLPAAPLSRPPVARLVLEVPPQDAGGAGLGRGGDCCRRWAASRPGRRACWCRRSR